MVLSCIRIEFRYCNSIEITGFFSCRYQNATLSLLDVLSALLGKTLSVDFICLKQSTTAHKQMLLNIPISMIWYGMPWLAHSQHITPCLLHLYSLAHDTLLFSLWETSIFYNFFTTKQRQEFQSWSIFYYWWRHIKLMTTHWS